MPVIESDSSLEGFTVYRPKDLSGGKLPIVVWGNGACMAFGGMYRGFLSEIASRGYLVIALGKFGPEDVRTMQPPARRKAPVNSRQCLPGRRAISRCQPLGR